jgi:hypothetical protein
MYSVLRIIPHSCVKSEAISDQSKDGHGYYVGERRTSQVGATALENCWEKDVGKSMDSDWGRLEGTGGVWKRLGMETGLEDFTPGLHRAVDVVNTLEGSPPASTEGVQAFFVMRRLKISSFPTSSRQLAFPQPLRSSQRPNRLSRLSLPQTNLPIR